MSGTMIEEAPGILFMTRCPPDPNGYGGAQRAWHVLQALKARGPVDLVVIYRQGDTDVEAARVDADRLGVRFCAKHLVKGWEEPLKRWPSIPYKLAMVLELVSPYCTEAPRLPSRTLRGIAALLPSKRYGVVVAGRLPAATILSELGRMRLLESSVRIFEMDDVLSRYKRVWLDQERRKIGRLRSWQWKVDAGRIAAAERRMIREWDAVSVCAAEDVKRLLDAVPSANVHIVANIVDKEALPVREGPARILFVGSLASHPNLHGLSRFLDEAWPLIRRGVPGAVLDVVGLHPPPGLRERLEAQGGRLHANVPDVKPYYEAATVVISPIFFGSGTRIKVLEAMAFGRALVASTLGAEGLGMENGRHALIADEMPAFADAVVRLCREPEFRRTLALEALNLQRRRFGPSALRDAFDRMVDGVEGGRTAAADPAHHSKARVGG